MKWALFIAAFIGSIATLMGQEIHVSLSPNPILQNEAGMISFSIPGDLQIQSIEFPNISGIIFDTGSTSQSTQYVNGQVSHSLRYGITVAKTGTLTIPSIKLNTSKGEKFTRPYTFTVGKRSLGLQKADGKAVEMSDVTRIWASLSSKKNHYYAGEMVPFEVHYAYDERLPFTVRSFPEVKHDANIIFQQYQIPQSGATIQFNPNNITQSISKIEGENFRIFTFNGAFRALKAGKYSFDIHGSLGLREATTSRSFFDFEDREVPCPLSTNLINIEIENLPFPPENVVNLALISPHVPTVSLKAPAPKMGEAMTLELMFTGSVDGLKTPDLSIEGFRVFPPEQTKLSEEYTRVRYLIVPLQLGKQTLNLTFATFNSALGKWQEIPFHQELNIVKSDQIVVSTQKDLLTGSQQSAETQVLGSDILYIKSLSSEPLMQNLRKPPQWKGGFQSAGIIILISTLVLGVSEFLLWHKRRLEVNPHYMRRQNAKKRKTGLIKQIQSATESNFEALVRTDVVDYIVDLKELPRGTDVYALEKIIKNRELLDLLQSAENASYRMESRCDNLKEKVELLLKLIKKGVFIFILSAVFVQFANATDSSLEKGKLAQLTDEIIVAEKAYGEGDFNLAYQSYTKIAALAPHHAFVWFDLGNSAYQLKRYPESLLYYERARRYDPANDDILANLNACCTQLGVPLRGEVNAPLDFLRILRDELRPSGWVVFSSIGIGIFLLVIARGRWNWSHRIWIGIGVGVIVFSVGCTMALWQKDALYSQNESIITVKKANVWNLPTTLKSAKKMAQLYGGQTVMIQEKRDNWYLVRYAGGEGWVNSKDLHSILDD